MIVIIMKCYQKKKKKRCECKFANLLPSSPSYMGICYVAGFMNLIRVGVSSDWSAKIY